MDGTMNVDHELLSQDDLPDGFSYPPEFRHLLTLGIFNLDPWRILHGEYLRQRFVGLKKRYTNRELIPFARRIDNDDMACWDLQDGSVAVIHDFSTPGWENRDTYRKFNDWLRQAVDDLIEFEYDSGLI